MSDLDPGLEHLLLTLQDRALTLPAEQAQLLNKHLVTFTSQLHAVQHLQVTQEKLTAEQQLPVKSGVEPIPNASAPSRSQSHGSMQKHAAGASKPEGSKPGQPTPSNGHRRSSSSKAGLHGEELLQHYFSITDTLGPEEMEALAAEAEVSQEHVRSVFEKLRGSVRTFLQRMQSRAARASLAEGKHQQPVAGAVVTKAEPDGEAGAQEDSTVAAASQKREEEISALSTVLDPIGAISAKVQVRLDLDGV